jgi:choline-sulfatase
MRSLYVCLLALLFTQEAPANDPPSPRRMNLLFIVTDDQASWSIGAYGNGDSRTPNMDRLAREGALFTNAFVTTPVCSPSRASFLTGRHGTELGITDWLNAAENNAGLGLPADIPTWPRVLQSNGYFTALLGKWHLGTHPHCHPTQQGYSHFFGFLGGGTSPMNPVYEVEGEERKMEGYGADLLTEEAIWLMETKRDQPFAISLHNREPHQPYLPVPPDDHEALEGVDPVVPQGKAVDTGWLKDRTRDYYRSIHSIDRNVGRLLAKMDELGLSENTIVIFTSDHGYNIGHHHVYTKGNAAWIAGAGVHGPKRPNMFEESIRVPLLVRWPGVVQPGMRIERVVSNLDTFATVLGMLGIDMPPDVKQNGRDFSPLLRGETIEWSDELYGQYDLHNSGLAFMRMIRTPKWKLVRHHMANGLNELYNLEDDPGETKNLYRNRAAQKIRQDLQTKLTAWQESIDDPILQLDANRPFEPPLE